MSGNLYNIDDYTINDIVTILDLSYPIPKDIIDAHNAAATLNKAIEAKK